MTTYPVTVSMTPSFFDREHMLLRAQLKCLSLQTVKDFDVWLIDPHYNKRKSIIPELAERFKLNLVHVPYRPNQSIAKLTDCAIFNAAFCYSTSPINARYSCYRFVRPEFIEAILNVPKGVNVDFHMLAVGPDIIEDTLGEPKKKHLSVWNFDGEDVNWDAVPKRSGKDQSGKFSGRCEDSLAQWHPESDQDTEPMTVPTNLYGNLAWYRDQWFEINGTNEVITNASHWEDIDFDYRAGQAGQQVVRRTRLMYRLHHTYGPFSQRANVQVDHPFKPPCNKCHRLMASARGDDDYPYRLIERICRGKINVYDWCMAWVCRECKLSGPLYDAQKIIGYLSALGERKLIRAPIISSERIGRNLPRLAEVMDKEPTLQGKVEAFNDSWSNPDYYQN